MYPEEGCGTFLMKIMCWKKRAVVTKPFLVIRFLGVDEM